jgi:hypothetical protein
MKQQASSDPEAAVGMVSSTEQVLSSVWSVLGAAADATGATEREEYLDLIGCCNLPGSSDPEGLEDYYFWSGGFGAALKTHGLVCRLVHSYGAHIGEHFTSEGLCDDDFVDFVVKLMKGKDASNYSEECSSDLRIHYMDTDSETATTFRTLWLPESLRQDEYTRSYCSGEVSLGCGDGFYTSLCATARSDLKLTWLPLTSNAWGYFYHGYDPNNTGTVTASQAYNAYPSRLGVCESTGVATWPNYFDIQFHSIDQTYVAFLVDWILFVTRIALDFSYDMAAVESYQGMSRTEYRDAAFGLGRYALCVVQERGARLIHELGHTWLGAGHAEYECCFEIAALSWRCKVSGKLGLPLGALFSEGVPETSARYTTRSGCVFEDEQAETPYYPKHDIGFDYSCTLFDVGDPGGRSMTCVDRYESFTVQDETGNTVWYAEVDIEQSLTCDAVT